MPMFGRWIRAIFGRNARQPRPAFKLDTAAIAGAVAEHKPALEAGMRTHLKSAIESMPPYQCLTLRLLDGEQKVRVIAPAASLNYAGSLYAFMRGQPYDGYAVDSAVTPVAADAVAEAIAAFYASEEVRATLTQGIVAQVDAAKPVAGVVRSEIRENLRWLSQEAKALDPGSRSIAGAALDATIHGASDALQGFLGSALGQKLLLVMSKVMATAGGKILVIKAVQIVAAKVMTSAVLHTFLLTVIKKVGVGIVMKTAIGKALLAVLAIAGMGSVPAAAVLLPIIAGLLVYEYHKLPARLAAKVPDAVTAAVGAEFEGLNTMVVDKVVGDLLAGLVDKLTEIDDAAATVTP